MRAILEDDEAGGVGIGLARHERLLWEGRPRWTALAVHAFHARKIAIYFALLAAWSAIDAVGEGADWLAALASIKSLALPAALGIGCALFLGWVSARTTLYRLTDKRLLLRVGMALPASVYIPLRLIDSAGLRVHRDGSGDIPIVLPKGERFAYLLLWPHARPWTLRQPQPMLRAIDEPQRVAAILAGALAATAEASTVSAPARASRPITADPALA